MGSRLMNGFRALVQGPMAKSYLMIVQWKCPSMIAQVMLFDGVISESCTTTDPVAAVGLGAGRPSVVVAVLGDGFRTRNGALPELSP